MKLAQYKCRFNHVTIKEFESNKFVPSVIECEKCKEESTSKVMKFEHPYYDRNYTHSWPSKKLLEKYKPEMAARC